MTFVNTPDEKRYKFYSAPGGVFKFQVSCSNDCHVALSNQSREVPSMYEIVIGGWNNTKSVIRQIGQQPDLVEASTPAIVSANELRGFWIRWHDNVVAVGREGETVSFMSYKGPNPFFIKYVGICTAYGSTGSWLFGDTKTDDLVSANAINGDFASIEQLKFEKTPNEKKYKFYPARGDVFTFKVCCSNDCHVALSTQPQEGLPMYEIVFGGWNNTKSVIRQIGKQPDLVEASTPAIVNDNELRGFWIRWHENVISVGCEGEGVSFMSYKDPNLFPVKYVGICTAYGSTGYWLLSETPSKDVAQLDALKVGFADTNKVTFVKTPNEKRYKFYPANGGVFAFNIYCSNDCHVALSTQPQEGLPMYEIVLGGWNNTKSVIRQIGKQPDLVEAPTPPIVNANEVRGFWIRWHDNVISVGRKGETVSFMSYRDPNLFPVKYVGICTAYGSTGYWLFEAPTKAVQCGFEGNENLKVVKTPNEKRYKFYPARDGHFTFKVFCSNDCHVALSTQPQEGLPMYEIVLGGWNNTKSVIRQIGKQPDLVKAPTPHIVSDKEVRGFWVRWHDNVITVGCDGEDVPFMSYTDPKLFPVKYVGICTAYGSTGCWLFGETFANGLSPLNNAIKSSTIGNNKLTFVKTPNEKKYKFYPARDGQFKFNVFCSNDCHVALSTQPQEGLPMFEIVLGGWNNTKSVIRQIGKQPDLVEASTPAIINENELRGFWIRWHENVISVGCEGEDVSFMSYKDPNLFPVKYVGICTAYGSTGCWLFRETSTGSAPPNNVVKAGVIGPKKWTFVKTATVKAYKFFPVREGIFTFQVCCSSDCYVALSTQPLKDPPLYEIVIGGWKNSKSVIRQIGMEPPEVDEAPTPRIVDANEMREFWIRWQNNVISVGRKGETVSFMSHKDPNLFPIKYVGVSTGYGITGSWLFEDTAGAGVWVAAANGVIPPNALKGGFAGNDNFIVARAQHEGNLLPGRLHPSQGTCYVTHKGAVLAKKEYEVLCSAVGSWSPVIDGNIPPNAVVGGYTDDGESLFIGRAQHSGTLSSGKVQLSKACCYIAYGSAEIACAEYEIYIAINDLIK